MVKPPKAFAPGNCNAWPDSRCSSKQYFSNFFQRCNVAAVLKSEVVHDEAPPKSYKSASSPATRPNPWPFDICHHHSTNTTTITPRLSLPLLRFNLHRTLIFIQDQEVDLYVLPFGLVTLSNNQSTKFNPSFLI